MLRSLIWTLALSVVTTAALLVPIEGRSIWDRARDRGIPQAVGRQADRSIAWLKTVGQDAPKAAPAKKADKRAAQARAVKNKPAEQITKADRAELDELIRGR